VRISAQSKAVVLNCLTPGNRSQSRAELTGTAETVGDNRSTMRYWLLPMSQLIFRTAFLERLSFRETLAVVAYPQSALWSWQGTFIEREVASRPVVAKDIRFATS